MNLPPLPLTNGALLVDNSMLELLTTCPRALEYNKLYKRVLSQEKPSLNFGSAIHLALEYRYKRYANLPIDKSCEEVQGRILTDHFAAHPPPLEDFRTLNWAQELVQRYNTKYSFEEFQMMEYKEAVDCVHCDGRGYNATEEPESVESCLWCSGTGLNKTMVELPFALPLFEWEGWLPEEYLPVNFPKDRCLGTEIRKVKVNENGTEKEVEVLYTKVRILVIYTGRIDLPILRDGSIFILDHKTTSILGPSFWDKLKMSAQQKGYAWAFEQLTGQKVHGYGVNAIRVKEPPNFEQQAATAVKNGKLSAANMTKWVETKTKEWWGESLDRNSYYLSEGELEEWRLNAISLIKEFFYHYQNDFMPQKTSFCTVFGRCAYFDVCSTFPPSSRPVILQSGMFTENTWTPLHSNKPKTQNQQ